jgi:hypothetical protein
VVLAAVAVAARWTGTPATPFARAGLLTSEHAYAQADQRARSPEKQIAVTRRTNPASGVRPAPDPLAAC